MQKKYKLRLDLKLNIYGKTLYRIESLIDFSFYKKGDLGGYVEREENLSHEGNAWVYGNAMVYGNARVSGDAQVYGMAWVYGNAMVYGNARVSGDAQVYGNAMVYGIAMVYGNTQVFDNARVYGNALVYGNAEVYGDAEIEKPHQIINLIGFRFSITLTLTTLNVGCKNLSPYEIDNYQYSDFKSEISEEEFNLTKQVIKLSYERMLSIEMGK